MRTIELDQNYDLMVVNGNLSVQRDDLSCIRQTIVNKLSLVRGEDPSNLSNGLNLDIMFGDNVPNSDRLAEIRRVIFLEEHVVSVDSITMEVDTNLRIGYFTCYITVSIDGTEVQTSVKFGV